MHTYVEGPKGRGGGQTFTKKGVTVRFGFDVLRISQVQTVSQKQSNKGRPVGYIYIQALLACYIYHRGAFGVARFD